MKKRKWKMTLVVSADSDDELYQAIIDTIVRCKADGLKAGRGSAAGQHYTCKYKVKS